jgi:tripartite-type tricarboxylate transporter receptor subunit TctC
MNAMRRFLRIVAAAAGALTAVAAAMAEPYPNGAVKVLVPFPPGGSTDVGARVVAEYLSRNLGQAFYVENKSGGGGIIGIEAAARSSPDGYTLLIAPDSMANAPHIYKMKVDPLKDLIPVIQLSRQPMVLAVHPSLGVKSLAELVVLAKQRPEGLTYVTSGIGSPQHIAAQWFAHIAGIKLESVPYRGGGQAISDLVAGHVKIASLGASPLIPHFKAGKLRLLAQTTAARSPQLPDVPTYEESGIKGLVLEQWLGVFAPTGTPATIVMRLNREIGSALSNAAVRASFLQFAQEPIGGTPDQLGRLLRQDFEKYGRLVKELNVKAD